MTHTRWIDRLSRPEPYSVGASIWTDARIAPNMLAAHLDAQNDAASYRPSRRDEIVSLLLSALKLQTGMRLLDVGCGPGLYATAFARRGVSVVGVDLSESAIGYAKERATRDGLPIRYIRQDYRKPFPMAGFDAAIMISEDYGVLSPDDRSLLLRHIRGALRKDAYFALDVASDADWRDEDGPATWSAEASGFYRPHPHLVLTKTWRYPEIRVSCRQVAVLDEELTVYNIHQTYFTPGRLRAELEAAGFAVETLLGNLDGAIYAPEGRQFGVIARVVPEGTNERGPIEVREVSDPDERAAACEAVLRSVPHWFGIESATQGFVRAARDLPLCAAYAGDRAVGFLALHGHNAHTAEIHAMAVRPEYHRQGIGRRLVEWARAYARASGHVYLTVKTVADTDPDEGYARTRGFYASMGFIPLEVFPTLWGDEANPCLFLVMPLT